MSIRAVALGLLALQYSTNAQAGQATEAVLRPNPVISSIPKVVSTSPSAGEIVDAGELTVRVTFDHVMREDSYSFVTRPDQGLFPHCEGLPDISPDRKSVTWSCEVESGKQYVIWVNSPPYMAFISAETGKPATPFQMHFKTR